MVSPLDLGISTRNLEAEAYDHEEEGHEEEEEEYLQLVDLSLNMLQDRPWVNFKFYCSIAPRNYLESYLLRLIVV